MRVYVTKIEPLKKNLNEVLALLPLQRQKKAMNYTIEQSRLQSIYAGLLIRHAYLAENREIPWEAVDVDVRENGKPYFKNVMDFHYSLSHSGDYVAVANDSMNLGIDIQKLQEPEFDIAGRFFNASELIGYEKTPEIEKKDRFYDYWCMKEACSKMNGDGFPSGLTRYTFIDKSKAYDTKMDKDVFIRIFDDIPGYKCICASDKAISEDLKLEIIEAKSLY